MRRTRQTSQDFGPTDPLAKVRRHRRRGEFRSAMLAMREICYRAADDARLWTLYAHHCLGAGRRDDALHALKQAVWLRQRNQDASKARVTLALLSGVLAGNDVLRFA